MSNAELVAEARRVHGDYFDPWPCLPIRLADALDVAEAEKAVLVADNAALLRLAWHEDECALVNSLFDPCDCSIAQDHPGAALLARLKRLEAVAEAAKAVWRDWSANEMPNPACLDCLLELNRTLERLEKLEARDG